MKGRIFLFCEEGREEYFRGVLEGAFALETFSPRGPASPEPGDLVLVDCVDRAGDWQGFLRDLRQGLAEGARLVAVLNFEQMRALDRREPVDDFISEGSTGVEMRARLRLRAAEEAETAGERSGLEIDADRYEVRVDGMPVELTFKEFELLRFLASRPGKVFTREMLLEQVWGYDYFGGSRTVDVHVRRIRSKIEREGRVYIRTVRGVGYIFESASPSA